MPNADTPQSANPLASVLGAVFFGLLLAGAGAWFCWLMAQSFAEARVMAAWHPVPCEIVESRLLEVSAVPNTPVSFEPRILYRYRVGDAEYLAERVRKVQPKSSRREKMFALVEAYPAGGQSVCFIDPQRPASSVLVRDGTHVIYSVWFPAVFVVGGIGIAAGSVHRYFRHPKS